MTDLKPLSDRPTHTLPQAHYPVVRKPLPPQQPPAPVISKPEPKVPPLDVAEALFHGCMRDGVLVSLVFLDGERFDATPLAIGKYSYLVKTESGSEAAVFKVALKSIGRAK
jgi:hypothetical protein